MASEAVLPKETPQSTADSQRKLWFEYLSKLNDREIQSASASGFTPWALVAVAAAIIYQCVPQIPAFLSIPGVAKTSVLILLLEIDTLFFVGCSIVFMIVYSGPNLTSRLLPEHNIRAARTRTSALRILVAGVAVAHFLVFRQVSNFRFVRGVLFAYGLLWFVNLAFGIWQDFKMAREAKKLGLPLPAFTVTKGSAVMATPVGALIVFVLGAIPLTALFLYVRSLARAGAPWVSLLGATADVLVVVAVLGTLFVLAVNSESRGIFLALERDIVLENFSPSEIRERFMRDIFGHSVGDWLETVFQKRRESIVRMIALTESMMPHVEEIEALDTNFPIERAGRAERLKAELDARSTVCAQELRGFVFQIQQLNTLSPGTLGQDILTRMMGQWTDETNQLTEAASSVGKLKRRLAVLAVPPK